MQAAYPAVPDPCMALVGKHHRCLPEVGNYKHHMLLAVVGKHHRFLAVGGKGQLDSHMTHHPATTSLSDQPFALAERQSQFNNDNKDVVHLLAQESLTTTAQCGQSDLSPIGRHKQTGQAQL